MVGADALPFEALAGALIAALEQSRKQPEAVARWTERGQAFFQNGGKRGKKKAAGDTAAGTQGNNGATAAPDRAGSCPAAWCRSGCISAGLSSSIRLPEVAG